RRRPARGARTGARPSRPVPPALRTPATPRHRSPIVPAQNTVLTAIWANAAPMIPSPATVTRRNVAGIVSAEPPAESHIGVRVSPAARIADTPMIEIVWNTFNPPIRARYGAPADDTSSSA